MTNDPIWDSTSSDLDIEPLPERKDMTADKGDLVERMRELEDLAINVAGMDDALLKSANIGLLRATLRDFRDQARALSHAVAQDGER